MSIRVEGLLSQYSGYKVDVDKIKQRIEKQNDSACGNNAPEILEKGIEISDSARELALTARDKVSEFRAMRFSSIYGEIREIPAEYKCENLFKLELKAPSISGGISAFEGHAENQAMVFEQWIDENATEYLSADEIQGLKKQIGTIIAAVDDVNGQEGYRGTSFESVFLLSASEAALKKVNEMFVPKHLQAGFSEMIDEYVHFNEAARNSIMERMTPDYMVVGIGTQNESYKYKSEIIADEKSFYENEKSEISDLCNQVLDDKVDKSSFYNRIEKCLNNYYGNRYELKNQPGAVGEKVNDMLSKLQKMYAFKS